MEIAQFGVEEFLNVWENDAEWDIAGSSISSMTLDEIIAIGDQTKEEFLHNILHKTMNYGWIEGSDEFKEEVCKLYDNVKPSQVLQTNGATGANFLALYGLLEPNDHVVALHPSYQQMYDIPKSFKAKVDFWEIYEDNNWLPKIEELKKLVTKDTKMITLVNANNPTGAVMDRKMLQEVVDIARSVNAYVLVDEIYRPFEEGLDVPSIVDLYELGISTCSVSKTYSVPGVRVGWIVANDELSNVFRKYRDYTMICCGVFDDYLATYVLRNKEAILNRNRQIVRTNLAIVKEWVKNEPRASLIFPKEVSTSFLKLDVPGDIEQFCINILKDEKVLLVPGNRFGIDHHVRLGYCTKTPILQEGLKRLSKYLRQFD